MCVFVVFAELISWCFSTLGDHVSTCRIMDSRLRLIQRSMLC